MLIGGKRTKTAHVPCHPRLGTRFPSAITTGSDRKTTSPKTWVSGASTASQTRSADSASPVRTRRAWMRSAGPPPPCPRRRWRFGGWTGQRHCPQQASGEKASASLGLRLGRSGTPRPAMRSARSLGRKGMSLLQTHTTTLAHTYSPGPNPSPPAFSPVSQDAAQWINKDGNEPQLVYRRHPGTDSRSEGFCVGSHPAFLREASGTRTDLRERRDHCRKAVVRAAQSRVATANLSASRG
jgi:hypothetical protein